MFPEEMIFSIGQDSRTKQYSLNVSFDRGNKWSIYKWDKEPTKEEIKNIKTIVLRSIEVYYRHIKPSYFNLNVLEREG